MHKSSGEARSEHVVLGSYAWDRYLHQTCEMSPPSRLPLKKRKLRKLSDEHTAEAGGGGVSPPKNNFPLPLPGGETVKMTFTNHNQHLQVSRRSK